MCTTPHLPANSSIPPQYNVDSSFIASNMMTLNLNNSSSNNNDQLHHSGAAGMNTPASVSGSTIVAGDVVIVVDDQDDDDDGQHLGRAGIVDNEDDDEEGEDNDGNDDVDNDEEDDDDDDVEAAEDDNEDDEDDDEEPTMANRTRPDMCIVDADVLAALNLEAGTPYSPKTMTESSSKCRPSFTRLMPNAILYRTKSGPSLNSETDETDDLYKDVYKHRWWCKLTELTH